MHRVIGNSLVKRDGLLSLKMFCVHKPLKYSSLKYNLWCMILDKCLQTCWTLQAEIQSYSMGGTNTFGNTIFENSMKKTSVFKRNKKKIKKKLLIKIYTII